MNQPLTEKNNGKPRRRQASPDSCGAAGLGPGPCHPLHPHHPGVAGTGLRGLAGRRRGTGKFAEG